MRGGSGRPARIKSARREKTAVYALLFCAAAAAAAGSEPAELKLLSYNIRYIGAPGRRRRLRMGRPQGGFDPHDPRRAAGRHRLSGTPPPTGRLPRRTAARIRPHRNGTRLRRQGRSRRASDDHVSQGAIRTPRPRPLLAERNAGRSVAGLGRPLPPRNGVGAPARPRLRGANSAFSIRTSTTSAKRPGSKAPGSTSNGCEASPANARRSSSSAT